MIRSKGIVRKVDGLGRIVIPVEMRRVFDIKEGDSIEIFSDSEQRIMMSKYVPGCVICGSVDQLQPALDKQLCQPCGVKIARSVKL